MKQLGNLAIVCSNRTSTLLQIQNNKAAIHIGSGPNRKTIVIESNDDEKILQLIHELNFGKFKEDVA